MSDNPNDGIQIAGLGCIKKLDWPDQFLGFGPPATNLNGNCWPLYVDQTNKCVYVWDGTKWCKIEAETQEINTLTCKVYEAPCIVANGTADANNSFTLSTGLAVMPDDKVEVYAPGRLFDDTSMGLYYQNVGSGTYDIQLSGFKEACPVRVEITRMKEVNVIQLLDPNRQKES